MAARSKPQSDEDTNQQAKLPPQHPGDEENPNEDEAREHPDPDASAEEDDENAEDPTSAAVPAPAKTVTAVGPIQERNLQRDTPSERQARHYDAVASALQPGDEGYNPHHDPIVPSSVLADVIATELYGSEGAESPTWNALDERRVAEQRRFEAHEAAERNLHDTTV